MTTNQAGQDERETAAPPETLGALVDQASDLLVVVSAEGRLVWVNRPAERAFGEPAATLRGQGFFDRFHTEDVEAARAAFAERGRPCTVRGRRRDGGWVDLELTVGASTPGGTVVSARDVSEKRRLETALRQAQKMNAVGRLAGGVAHDFNNLLTTINGYSDLLLAKIDEADPSRHALEEIQRAGRRAGDLTRRLLILSRHQDAAPRRLDLNQVVDPMERLLRRVLGEDVELSCQLDSDLGPILADLGQVEQVVLNLVVHAREALPHGGRLEIETAAVTAPAPDLPTTLPPGRHARLTFRITAGRPSSPYRDHLAAGAVAARPAPRGGSEELAVVHAIVSQGGGVMETEPGDGTDATFRLYFPRVVPEAAAPAAEPPPRGHERVLLVEDEEPVRRLLAKILAMQGYEVHAAASAAEALELFSTLAPSPDVLLTDVVMPGQSGLVLAEALRLREPKLRILFISGYTDRHAEIRELVRQGANFLPKPFTPDELGRKLRAVLEA